MPVPNNGARHLSTGSEVIDVSERRAPGLRNLAVKSDDPVSSAIDLCRENSPPSRAFLRASVRQAYQ